MLSETMEKSVVATEYDEEGNPCVAVYSGRHDSKMEVSIAKDPHPTPFGPLVMCWAGLEALSPLSRALSSPTKARP
jgi:hypothetical protein